MKNKILGSALMIAGTTIGAGMLANPTSTAGVWFIGSILALIYTWFCMTTSGLMILEANLHYPTGSSFDTIVKDLLGKNLFLDRKEQAIMHFLCRECCLNKFSRSESKLFILPFLILGI